MKKYSGSTKRLFIQSICALSITLTAVAVLSVGDSALARSRERPSDGDGWSFWGFGSGSSSRSRDERSRDRPSRRRGGGYGAYPKTEAPKNVERVQGPLYMIVSIGSQTVSLYGNDGLVAKSPVSTGTRGHDTPTGVFSILEKDLHHRSNIYSAAPMPYMQRITWSGVALHQGVLPGYAASHGCIRMPSDFAQRLWGLTQGRERVVVAPRDVVPVAFSHPKLPVPRLYNVAGSENMASMQVLRHVLAVTKPRTEAVQTAEKVDVNLRSDAAPNAAEARKFINPIEFAKIMKAQAAAKIEAADAATKAAKAAATAKSLEANSAMIEARKADMALAVAKAKLQGVEAKSKYAKDDEAVQALNSQRAAAETMVKEVETRVAAIRASRDEKTENAARALAASKQAELSRRSVGEMTKSWTRRLEPVSVFISRKESRLYIRQGYIKVFDVPVTIKNPEEPIGTHLFMAMQPEAHSTDQTPALRWVSISVPEGPSETKKPGKVKGPAVEQAPTAIPASTEKAAAALDRIEFPAEVSDTISDLLWTGGSVMISDYGISRETSTKGSDFVILTR